MAIVRADGFEIVNYNVEDIPVYFKKSKLSRYPNFSEIAHWHEEIEFLAVLSGDMAVNVNGEIVFLSKNQGIFINSKQVHFGYSPQKRECDFICLVCNASSLSPSEQFFKERTEPLLGRAAPFETFSLSGAGKEIFLHLLELQSGVETSPFFFMEKHYALLNQLKRLVDERHDGEKPQHTRLEPLKNMLNFIYEHSSEKITLADIARAGNVCRSGCIAMFEKFLHQSPVNFLIEYRLDCAKRLLMESDKNVTEISENVGFSSVSYFIQTFKQTYGNSPLVFRKNAANV